MNHFVESDFMFDLYQKYVSKPYRKTLSLFADMYGRVGSTFHLDR
jgi:hypothetical protein